MKKRSLSIVLALLLALAPLAGCDLLFAPQQPAATGSAPTAAPETHFDLPLIADEPGESGALPELTEPPSDTPAPELDEHGAYTSRDDVALYLYLYGRLPYNFMTKDEARKLGWSGGGLDDYAYGMCIGGDRFGNNEDLLPEKNGRTYYECDIDTLHASRRGAKRIVFSSDGLIYYTDDHYASFTLLYGEEN